jgi:heptosyltransferase-1
VREAAASLFYTERVQPKTRHVVDQNLELAAACGGRSGPVEFPLPEGEPEGDLGRGPFVLACPLAGWGAKQWPLEHYAAVAARLRAEGWRLVVNGAPSAREQLERIEDAEVHTSGIPGLIHATRKAGAVLGVDSGPLHLAAALGKPGVAIYGPTDPLRNGPYAESIRVLRQAGAATSYKRRAEADASMAAVGPDEVFAVMRTLL